MTVVNVPVICISEFTDISSTLLVI